MGGKKEPQYTTGLRLQCNAEKWGFIGMWWGEAGGWKFTKTSIIDIQSPGLVYKAAQRSQTKVWARREFLSITS